MPGILRDAAAWTPGRGQGSPFMLHNPRLKGLGRDPGREPSSRARPALDSSLNPLERPHLGDARPRRDSVDRQGDSEAGGGRRAGTRWMTRSFKGRAQPCEPRPGCQAGRLPRAVAGATADGLAECRHLRGPAGPAGPPLRHPLSDPAAALHWTEPQLGP